MYDLTLRKFGSLTVIRQAPNIGKYTAWICRCDCGKVITVKTKYLLSGKKTGCDCMRKKSGIEKLHYIDGTCIEMIENKKVRANNRSGVTGVHFDTCSQKWRAEIMMQGKHHTLGRFNTMEEAVKARKNAEADLHDKFVKQYRDETADSDTENNNRCGG